MLCKPASAQRRSLGHSCKAPWVGRCRMVSNSINLCTWAEEGAFGALYLHHQTPMSQCMSSMLLNKQAGLLQEYELDLKSFPFLCGPLYASR